jgi:hypothetical protein
VNRAVVRRLRWNLMSWMRSSTMGVPKARSLTTKCITRSINYLCAFLQYIVGRLFRILPRANRVDPRLCVVNKLGSSAPREHQKFTPTNSAPPSGLDVLEHPTYRGHGSSNPGPAKAEARAPCACVAPELLPHSSRHMIAIARSQHRETQRHSITLPARVRRVSNPVERPIPAPVSTYTAPPPANVPHEPICFRHLARNDPYDVLFFLLRVERFIDGDKDSWGIHYNLRRFRSLPAMP